MLVYLGECVFERLDTRLGEALNPTAMAKGHSAWGVLVCTLSFTLLSSFSCVTDTPLPGIAGGF